MQAFGFDLSANNALAVQVPSLSPQPFFSNGGFFGFIADPGTSLSDVRINCGARGTCVGIGRVDINNISVVPAVQAVGEPSATLALEVFIPIWLAISLKLKKSKKRQLAG